MLIKLFNCVKVWPRMVLANRTASACHSGAVDVTETGSISKDFAGEITVSMLAPLTASSLGNILAAKVQWRGCRKFRFSSLGQKVSFGEIQIRDSMSLAEIETLIAKVSLGDRKAFEALYDATSAKLFGVILRVLKDKSAAEDALQDTYLKIWKNANRYASNGLSPMTWLITIARNTAIDRRRSTKPTDDLADLEDTLVVAAEASPEATAIAASEARRIAGCMEELGADRRNAVKGAYLHGQSYADLAAQFNVPLNTMRTWLRRSLIALRECMKT